jgi:hypothetical protein
VIGTAGAVSASLASGVFGRGQTRTQVAATRAEWLLDNRRSTYQEFLIAVRAFENGWWALADALEIGHDGTELFERIVQLYAGLTGAAAGVQLLGPDIVADLARSLSGHLRDLDAAGTSWYRADDASAAGHDRDHFWALFHENGTIAEDFWRAAHKVLT